MSRWFASALCRLKNKRMADKADFDIPTFVITYVVSQKRDMTISSDLTVIFIENDNDEINI
jgi:hypothetical protein